MTSQSNTFVIYRRAFSQYTTFGTFDGCTWLLAMEIADAAQRMYRDGEYIVRKHGEPAHITAPATQSGLDYL